MFHSRLIALSPCHEMSVSLDFVLGNESLVAVTGESLSRGTAPKGEQASRQGKPGAVPGAVNGFGSIAQSPATLAGSLCLPVSMGGSFLAACGNPVSSACLFSNIIASAPSHKQGQLRPGAPVSSKGLEDTG